MALAYPVGAPRGSLRGGQIFALALFVIFYTALGAFRYETGGDWLTYDEMFEDMRVDTLAYAMTRTDPLYGFFNWLSAQLGTGIYLVNGVCCLVLAYGVVRVATSFREPWLAVLIAVPYLLIVVGFGYVRQGAAIGMMLLAIASMDRSNPIRTLVYLAIAVAFHSTAALTIPLFVFGMAPRNKLLATAAGVVGAAAFVFVLAPRLNSFELGYLEAEYDSGGAAARLVMSLVPSALIVLRWRHFVAGAKVRPVWLMMAVANFIAVVALVLSPSSTAVDRIALFFSVIQMAAFGEFRALAGVSDRMAQFTRLILIGVAVAVQSVWLIFGTHAIFWVPYQSVFENL
ncbi:EpsG family protein [Novosphingobium sp.]|uniref:EpsG family protein n=1 Tax=Novosphingobium sp. TaxID=1874826 RepID=UPI00286E7102|nr:EpsG family protein [Novosphingobium sp.]